MKQACPWSLGWLLEKLGLHSWKFGFTVSLYPNRSVSLSMVFRLATLVLSRLSRNVDS